MGLGVTDLSSPALEAQSLKPGKSPKTTSSLTLIELAYSVLATSLTRQFICSASQLSELATVCG